MCSGRGFYQEEGRDAVEMRPGDCINIPVDVKHWHGAAPDEWFSHLAIEVREWIVPMSGVRRYRRKSTLD